MPTTTALPGVTSETVRRLVPLLAGAGSRPSKEGGIVVLSGSTKLQRRKAVDLLSDELDREVLRVDLSQVESRYIGETEKNLARLLDRAARTGAILFFDEADALFGPRSAVTDAQDRYADPKVNDLLEQLARHPGPVVVTTGRISRLSYLPPALRRQVRAVTLTRPIRRRIVKSV
jgi:SpoVK/Ycf46/Vps4 family AAA+-type ATPase